MTLEDIIEKFIGHSDRDLLHIFLLEFHLLKQQNEKIMSAATDLQTLVDQLTASQAETRASLDNIKTGVATIVAGLPAAGGMTADEVAALKTSLTTALATEQANAAEASADAAAVAADQPAPAPAPGA